MNEMCLWTQIDSRLEVHMEDEMIVGMLLHNIQL